MEAGVRLESALEIVGALKRRFGEPMTVSDVCRAVTLSYQPVYEYLRRLAAQGAVALRKEGQRLLCEPAATAAGSVWLAHCSLRELRSSKSAELRELATALNGRTYGRARLAPQIAAVDPAERGGPDAYVTDAALGSALLGARVRVVTPEGLAEALVGEDRSWALARRIVPLLGHQLLWSICLAAREQPRSGEARPVERPASPHRRSFID